MASRVFKRDVLRILLSDFDEGSKETSLGIKERSYANGMFVFIMMAEHDCSRFRCAADFLNIMIRGS